MKQILATTVLILASIVSTAQAPFEIAIEPVTIPNMGGVHSYAVGQHNGKWLIIGGRLDGLHRRQPWASFDVAGNNDQLLVIDPVAMQSWTAPLGSLPPAIREQLSSTNMEFYQEGDHLYFIGGYGFSTTANDHITYPNMTAVNVPQVIDAVIQGNAFNTYFRQMTDQTFAVTGGYLEKIYDVYQLVGGQKFTGRYNPMNGPSFTQAYTNSVHRFTIDDDGVNLNVVFLPSFTDAADLHRRDFNVTPQIMPNGDQGLTAFSGVFQTTADIPYLNCVNIDSSSYAVIPAFSQYYNHYHCANIPLYSSALNEMHTVFFGGIAQYYDSLGTLVQDNDVPFVKTIARVTRDASGNMAEYKLPIEMPALLGSGAEFIPTPGLPIYPNEVIDMDALTGDTILAGHIYGGIHSTAGNIFWINDGTQSSASNSLFKVYLVRTATGIDELNSQSNSALRMQLYPNPYEGVLHIDLMMDDARDVTIEVTDVSGKLIQSKVYEKGTLSTVNGKSHVELELIVNGDNSVYFVTATSDSYRITQKLLVNK